MTHMTVIRILALLSCFCAACATESYVFASEDATEQLSLLQGASFRGDCGGVQVWHLEGSDAVTLSEQHAKTRRWIEADSVLLHLRTAALDQEVFSGLEAGSLERARDVLLGSDVVDQMVLLMEPQPQRLFASQAGEFWSVPQSRLHESLELLNTLPHLLPTLVAPYDLPVPGSSNVKQDEDRARIRSIIENLSFQSIIDRLARSIQAKHLRSIVRHLSAEDGKAPWKTRHSFTTGARLASEWLKHEYEKTGADCYLHDYFVGFSPNVICAFKPLTSKMNDTELPVVVIGAHYDDRGSFGHVQAPGADDDGSGSAMLLNLARTIKRYNIRFENVQVVLAAFSGEEQGLWGSRYFAKLLKEQGRDVLFMLQADMLAYRKPGEPLQVAYPDAHAIPESRDLITNISAFYTPELKFGQTPACCSDHQSFDDLGFASGWVFERAGPIADPKYHNSGDLSDREGYDWEQLRLISSLVLALLLSVAPFKL